MAVDYKKIVTYALLWLMVAVVVLWANGSVEEHRRQQPVTKLDIVVSGGGEQQLVDAGLLDEWLVLHDIHPEGRTLADVDIAELESVIAEHSAVASVNAYMTYDGVVTVGAVQRRAVARLRIDGYDMYVGSDGYVFPVTDCHLLSLPVITGEYKPLFDSSFVGFHEDSSTAPMADIDNMLNAIEQSRVDLLEERETINAELRRVEKQGVKRELLMSDDEYRGRVEALKERKMEARCSHAEKDRDIDLALRELEDRRLEVSLEADKLKSMVDDFNALIDFMEYVCDDAFWRAEIVQVVVSGGGDSPMQIAIVPRSGNFVVDLGYASGLVDKLATLRYFYDRTLSNVGWDKYKHISLRYDGQVVCK